MGGNAQIAYDWMIDRGYSPNIAAAFVGNMMQESYDDIDPTASDGSAFGICQWDDRKDALIQYANDNDFDVNDIYTQLNFMDYELHTSEKQAAADIEAAGDSPEDAAYVIANEYERCQVPNDSRRLQNSRDVYDTFYDGSDYQGSGIGNGNTSSGGSGTDNQIYYDISDVDGVDSDDETDLTKQKMNLLAQDYYNQFGRRLWITSMARSGDPNESWHNTGQAFDTASDALEQSAEERQWLIQKGSEYGLTALDEYEHPSAHATGGHVHFSDHGDALDPAVVKSLVGNAGNPVEFGGGFLDTDISRHLTPEEYQATIDNYHAWDTPTKAADNPPSLFESIWHGFKESGNFAYEAANALYNDLFYSDFDAFGKSKITDDDRQYVKDAMGAGNESTAQWIIDNSRDKTQMMRLLQQKMDDAQEDQRFAAYTSQTIGGQIGGLILGAALDPLNLAPMLKPLTVAKMITRLGSAVEDVGKIDQIANSVALADKASLKIPLAMGNIAAASTAQEYIRGKTTGEDTNLAGAALMGGIAGGVLKTLGMAGSRLLRNRELSNIATKADNVQYGSLNEAARNESAYTAKLDTKKIADSMNDNAFFSGSTNETAQSMADRDDVLALSLSDAKKLGNRLSINVPDNTKGFYVPNEGYSVIVKDNIKDAKQLSGVLMHEIGVHQNLQQTIGADKYGKLMSQIDTGIKNNDVMWSTAARMANSNDPEEVLGYAAENGLLKPKDKQSLIGNFRAGLNALGLGKQKFNNAQIMDMISESIKNSKLAQYGASVNSDGSVNMNGVHFSTDNLYSPSALEDYKAMAADRAEEVNNIGTENMTHRKFQRAINGVGNKLEDTKLTRTPFGFFLHSVSPTLSRMSTSIFEDPQMRGVHKITNMPSAERMTDYFRGQLQPYVQNILQARQDWVKQNYGAIGAYNPFRADNRRLPFDKMVIDNFNHEYRGTTISKAVSDQIDDNVRKATAELKKFWDARIDLGKSSGTLFSGKEENNLIENIWYPVNNEFHRLIDRDCYRDMVSHFHAPYKEKTGDEAAHKFLEDYCYEASGDPKSKQVIKDFIDRERKLEYQRKIRGMTPEEVKQYDKPVPASDKDVEDFRDIKAKEWAVKALNPVENTLDGKEVVDGKVIDSSLGDLNFFRGKLPMDTGHIKMLPDGTPFTFDDNMRYYDLEHMLNRTMNRFAGEAALKTVFGDSTNYHNFLEKVHREFNLAQLSGTISQSEVERMTKDFDDTMHDMRGMRPARDIYSDTDVIGKVFNNMAYATRGGNMGYNQLGDLGGSIAYNGLHTLFGVFNPLRKAVQDMRLGKAPSEMLDDLNFQMFGDPIERHIWQGSWGDRMTRAAMTKEFHGMSGVWHKALIGAANVTHNFGKFTSQINMLGHMTDTMIHEARSSALCDAIRFAHGKQFSGIRNPFSAQKIKDLGRHVDVEALKADIRKYIPWDGQKGTVPQEANVDAWRAESPKTFFELYDLVQNQTARSVLLSTQKGNRSMYKDQNWATRLLFMFKDFAYRSNNAQTMRALQNRDRDDAVALALSMITNTAAFAARNSLKVGALYAMGNSDAAQKVKDNYLNDGALARAALFRTGFLSPLSNVNDVVEAATGAPTIRTTVTNSGRGEPINDMGDVAGNVVKQIPAVDTISDYTIKPINAAIALSDGRGSQRDLRQMLKLIPVPDFIPYTQAIDTWSQMQGLPDKRPKKK